MPNLPLLHLQPQSCLMVADYHKNADHPDDADHWYRTAIVLQAVADYNDGSESEEMLRDALNLAYTGTSEQVAAYVEKLIRA